MKKNKKTFLGMLLAIVCVAFSLFAFVACAKDGVDGKDGKDGKDFDLYAVYEQLVEMNEFSGTYSEFVRDYLNSNVSGEGGSGLSNSINRALTSVVSIQSDCAYSYRTGGFWGGSTAETTLTSQGSGIIYQLNKEDGEAYIITNCHVIYCPDSVTSDGIAYTKTGTPTYTAYLYGLEQLYLDDYGMVQRGREYAMPCSLVGYSMKNDVAVLKIEDSEVLKVSEAAAAREGDSDTLYVGDDVFLIGNALGEGISATTGIVSVIREDILISNAAETGYITISAIRTDSVANHGNSGGGMFDKNGCLVGILFAGDNSDGTQGINCVLPINTVYGIADSIIENCNGNTLTTTCAQFGITVITESTEQVWIDSTKLTTKDTISIYEVSPGLAADGKLQVGDVLVSLTLGDTTVAVEHKWNIFDFLWKIRPGDTVSVTVLRGGEEVTQQITFSNGNFIAVE